MIRIWGMVVRMPRCSYGSSKQVDMSKFDKSQTATLEEKLLLVDHNDKEMGFLDKKTCHLNQYNKKGYPHRAFSLFIFDRNNRLLVHRRSALKIAFPLAWTNSCCSHPIAYEHKDGSYKVQPVSEAVVRRSKYELNLNLKNEKLFLVGKLLYRSPSDAIWGEHQLDYVYVCKVGQETLKQMKKNDEQIEQVEWLTQQQLKPFIGAKLKAKQHLSPWFASIEKSQLRQWWDVMKQEGVEGLNRYNNGKIHTLL